METSQAAESFRDLLLRQRGRTGLTQRELADRIGANRRTVQDWEAGVNYPSAERLQALIQALLEAGGLAVGREAAEAHAMWAAVLHDSPRMHTPMDEVWLAGLFAPRAAPQSNAEPAGAATRAAPGPSVAEIGADGRRHDWGDAPDVLGFVGRRDELAMVRDWILQEGCRLVAVQGMGGIGKTSFAAKLAEDVAPAFRRIYWRSLRNAPSVSAWLAGAIGFLSDQQLVPPEGQAAQLAALLELLRDRASLLVVDNFETVLQPGQREGRYREGFRGYGAVLRAIGETTHRSCVVVTSREAPPELAVIAGQLVRRLELIGLGVGEGQVLLADKQLSGKPEDWAYLVSRFGGNGLALKVVSETIHQVFGGDIGAFLESAGSAASAFGGIRRLLAEQIERSSALEQHVLTVLAVAREPVTITELIAELGPRGGRGAGLEALEALRRRSLVEHAQAAEAAAFTLQSVVLEYVTDRLVEELVDEIAHARPMQLRDLPLIQAQTKDYVRLTQEHLIGEPVLRRLEAELGTPSTEERLLSLLEGWRDRRLEQQGYGPGNVVNLLRLLRGNLRGMNLAHLALRQAYLAGVEAQDTILAGADLAEAALAEAFTYPICVALSGDGGSLAAGTSTGEVWLWRVADRTPLMAVRGHTGLVYCVALSADGRLLASGSEDGTVRLWAAPGGRPLATLEGHTGGVRGVALSADGRLLASGSWDGSVRLWESPGGQLLDTLQGPAGSIVSVTLCAAGRLLASGGEDGTLRVWETRDRRLLVTIAAHTGVVRSVALSPDGRLLASGGQDGLVRLWEVPSGRLLATFEGHPTGVWTVTLSRDGRLLASGGVDGTVRLWETGNRHLLATVPAHTGGVWSVALLANGGLLASSGQDGTVRLWEAPSARLLATLQGHTSEVWGVALAANGLLASGGQDGTVRLWEPNTGQLLTTVRGHTGAVVGVGLSADGRLLASGAFDGAVRLWEAPPALAGRREYEWRLLATMPGPTRIAGLALSADGRILAGGGEDGTVRLWEVPTGRLVITVPEHSTTFASVALSADGRLLVRGSEDATVRVWETPFASPDRVEHVAERLLAELRGHTGRIWGVALSGDGRVLASGGWDATVRLWDVAGKQPLATLVGHTGPVHGVALSADGSLVASGGEDGTVRLWNWPGGRLLAALQGHTGLVWSVVMSPDGRRVASGSWDGTVRLWDVSSGGCLATLRSDRRYERVDIAGLTGVTAAQRAALLALGAVEHPGRPPAGETTMGLHLQSTSESSSPSAINEPR